MNPMAVKPPAVAVFARGILVTLATQYTLHRTPARWCPLCGESSSICEWKWLWIEARDEEVVCANCCQIPRLWLKARTP